MLKGLNKKEKIELAAHAIVGLTALAVGVYIENRKSKKIALAVAKAIKEVK